MTIAAYIIAISIIALGMCSWYEALKNIKKEEKDNKKERKEFLKAIKSIDRGIKRLYKDLKIGGKEKWKMK